MATTEDIVRCVEALPESLRQEVLDFALFLGHRHGPSVDRADARPADDEHRQLGQSDGRSAARVWPKEDFSDWPGFPSPDAKGDHG